MSNVFGSFQSKQYKQQADSDHASISDVACPEDFACNGDGAVGRCSAMDS